MCPAIIMIINNALRLIIEGLFERRLTPVSLPLLPNKPAAGLSLPKAEPETVLTLLATGWDSGRRCWPAFCRNGRRWGRKRSGTETERAANFPTWTALLRLQQLPGPGTRLCCPGLREVWRAAEKGGIIRFLRANAGFLLGKQLTRSKPLAPQDLVVYFPFHQIQSEILAEKYLSTPIHTLPLTPGEKKKRSPALFCLLHVSATVLSPSLLCSLPPSFPAPLPKLNIPSIQGSGGAEKRIQERRRNQLRVTQRQKWQMEDLNTGLRTFNPLLLPLHSAASESMKTLFVKLGFTFGPLYAEVAGLDFLHCSCSQLDSELAPTGRRHFLISLCPRINVL
ncbi:uncharacterized protein LOC130457246 [Monodelphis domestica]|uniref:uncharacterized protein LOC130457246 n=1 Tax=Monodelphis domestica TaxID=13616 RepID=UPI0024E1FBB8|nr:uncharacterized protein LOC130457246 [Monodelphis domestica]